MGQANRRQHLTPFVDRASGGSLVEWITTLDGVLKLDFDTAIPGHGPVLTKENVRTFRQNLVTLRQRITEVVKAGAKKEEFGARLKTDDLGWPFPPERLERVVGRVWRGTLDSQRSGGSERPAASNRTEQPSEKP